MEAAVGDSKILFLEDVAGRVVIERDLDGDQAVTHWHKKKLVKEMSRSVAAPDGSKARVIDSAAIGDGRQRSLFLFPRELGDEVVVDYFLRSRDAGVRTAPPSTRGGEEACVQEV